jgi:hypothetical protein
MALAILFDDLLPRCPSFKQNLTSDGAAQLLSPSSVGKEHVPKSQNAILSK